MKQAMPVSIDKNMAEWIETLALNDRYRNKSHVVEVAMKEFQRRMMQNENSISS